MYTRETFDRHRRRHRGRRLLRLPRRGPAVKDLAASRAFYERFGFTAFAGDQAQHWLVLRNGAHVIPGWDQDAKPVAGFTDVRELQRRLKAQGVQLVAEADEGTAGPAYFMAVDPDGNPVLVDQHVPKEG